MRGTIRRLLVAAVATAFLVTPAAGGMSWVSGSEASGASEHDIERQIFLREQLHLRADEAHVREQMRRSDADEQRRDHTTLGLVLDDEEYAEMVLRTQVMDDAGRVQLWGTENADRFGGARIDHAAGGILIVSLLDEGRQAAEREIEDLVEVKDRLNFEGVEFTYDQLAEGSRAVVEEAREDGIDVLWTSVSVVRNGVDIAVPDETTRSEAEQRYVSRASTKQGTVIPNPRVVVEERAEVLPDNHAPGHGGTDDPGRQQFWNPMMAGLALDGCTSAVTAYDDRPTGRVYFVLSAGHCFPNGRNVSQGGAFLGRVVNSTNAGRIDIAAIDVSSGSGTTRGLSSFVYERPNYQDQHFVDRFAAPSGGDGVCLSGRFNPGTGNFLNCGVVVTPCFTPSGGTHWCFVRASYWAQDGDSGGIVYHNRTFQGVHKGQLWTGSIPQPPRPPSNDVIFTNGAFILQDMNLTGYHWSTWKPPPPPPPSDDCDLGCQVVGLVAAMVDAVLGLLP